MSKVSRRTVLLGVLGAGLLVGCSRDTWQRAPGPDDVVGLVPWFANMHTDIAIRPYKDAPRPPVAGTVPITGADPDLPVAAPTPAVIAELGRRLPNPVPNTAASIERGRDRYAIYCTPCHGDSGTGDGPVAAVWPGIPSLVSPQARAYTDGYLYAVIMDGRGLMPHYGDKIRGDDRWHVVNYMRVMQGTAP